ncbi:hypothetical protein [Candidatus Pyrohabitans sp.]
MLSLFEDLNLWLIQTSSDTGISLEIFIILLSANIVILITSMIFVFRRIREKRAHETEKADALSDADANS